MLQTLVRIACAALFTATLLVPSLAQELPTEEAAALLPNSVGEFRAQDARPVPLALDQFSPQDFHIVSVAGLDYVARDGGKFSVALIKTSSPSAAYSYLRLFGVEAKSYTEPLAPFRFITVEGLGYTADAGARIRFIKGASVIDVNGSSAQTNSHEKVVDFARQLAQKIDGDVGETPILIRHLPESNRHNPITGFAVGLPVLKVMRPHPVLDVISFEGGTEAAMGVYDSGQLIIVEFSTPQYSIENDARIQQRIAELRAAGEPVPSAYRREGNYSVFVFDAPDEAAAASLIEQVKYEKDVRWLGDNPRVGERVEQLYRTTMTGVLVTALKATGLAILICLGIGGIFGGAVFFYRRTRPAAKEAFTDAGGMMRLDIEDLNAPRDSSKLLGEAAKQYRER